MSPKREVELRMKDDCFITENSIEEKIQKLKERKSSLADKFINSNNPFQEITQDEIVNLFK